VRAASVAAWAILACPLLSRKVRVHRRGMLVTGAHSHGQQSCRSVR
jgi:hypothetical protein